MRTNNLITVLVDNESWILPYAKKLVKKIESIGFESILCRSAEDIQPSWISFMLGCTRIIDERVLLLNRHNIVVHESDLPKGRGFAPMTWQILEGANRISICLIEAGVEADAGDILMQDEISLNGYELCDELRTLQGEKTIEMCLSFIENYQSVIKIKQIGEPSYYMRRKPIDSRLDLNKTIGEQFNLLRVSDNERYPAFFEIGSQRYIVKIYKS